ncbi:MAG: MSCRAMM family adhesin SdrC, partial [SAR202 cluster bacterium]|nr:MSCRAMM family adhesin SdrC [SAR202 cluster bacterium]
MIQIFMYTLIVKKTLILGLFFLFSNFTVEAQSLKKVRRTVARLQMELLELKENSSKNASQQMAILEPQNEKIEFLTKENLELTKKLKDLELKFLLLEEKLENYQKESSTEQLSELNDLATVLALVTVGEISAIEPLVLELINKEDNNLKDDLLILLLAETQKNQGFIEKSLSYYVLLVSEYSESTYLNRAIFEASELLGQMGHTEQQTSMLEALKDSKGTYGVLARKKLGIEEPAENEDNQLDSDGDGDNQLDSDNDEDNQLDSDNDEDNQLDSDNDEDNQLD